jgi:hypothetical protein
MGYNTRLKFVRLTFDGGDCDDEVLLFPASGVREGEKSGRMADGSQNQIPGLKQEHNDEP